MHQLQTHLYMYNTVVLEVAPSYSVLVPLLVNILLVGTLTLSLVYYIVKRFSLKRKHSKTLLHNRKKLMIELL